VNITLQDAPDGRACKKIGVVLIIPGIYCALFLLPTLFQDQDEMLERGKRHIVEIVSCYTTHYKGILHFVLEENGINNKMLENDLYDLRYKQAEGFLPDAEKYVDAILKSTIPGDNSFCGKCYQYGMTYNQCKKIYGAVVYIEQMDPPNPECVSQ